MLMLPHVVDELPNGYSQLSDDSKTATISNRDLLNAAYRYHHDMCIKHQMRFRFTMH